MTIDEIKRQMFIDSEEVCGNTMIDTYQAQEYVEQAYNKAIDDFAEKLKEMANNSSTKYIRLSEKETIVTYGVEQIVKQLKERESEWTKYLRRFWRG